MSDTMAEETKGWTPGPWVATCWQGTVRGDVTGAETKGDQVSVHQASDLTLMIAPLGLLGDPESHANAHLIAAAPDLYEALQCCFDFIGTTQEYKTGHTGASAVADAARAALARARGDAQ